MCAKLPKILVTGGAGFIGSALVKLLAERGYEVIVVDKLTYAGDLARLKEVKGRYKFYNADICNKAQIESIFKKERSKIIVNFAAQTHVDRSIRDAAPFIETNVKGVHILLETSRKYDVARFLQISSDEVYGDIERGRFSEDSPLKPNSPYAASKAAADLLIRSYIRTHNFPAIIIRPCNNYGPWQYPEKLIPLAILKVLKGEKIPIYANGRNVREWLFVEDCVEGISQVLQKARLGEIYNLGSTEERQNIELAKTILRVLGKSENMIEFVQDRPGHDIRYRLNSRKVFHEIGWKPKIEFYEGLKVTLAWYLNQKDWLLNKHKNIARLYKRNC